MRHFWIAIVAMPCLFGQGTPPGIPGLPGWLKIGGEDRVRTEYVVGEGFRNPGDLYVLNRLRVNVGVQPWKLLKFTVQVEDSRVFGQRTRPAPASQKDAGDLRIGYAQLGFDEGPASLRVGRQSLDFGEGRLLADPNWSNVGRAFDAARLTLRRGAWKVDLFSGAPVKVDAVRFDRRATDDRLHGAYGTWRGLSKTTIIDGYFLWRVRSGYKGERGTAGSLAEKTVGGRWAGKVRGGLDYAAEVAGQSGSAAGDPIGAWMGHWVVGRTFAAVGKPRLYLEYNRASGDADPRDGRRGVFDALYPSAHDKFGLTDLFCAANLAHFRSGVQVAPGKRLRVGAAFNDYRLANAADGLYVGNKVIARNPAGGSATDVGRAADVQAQWAVSRTSAAGFGYGRLFPGEFLHRATPSAPFTIVLWSFEQRF